ncbi:unnamed protein product [Rotaria magnacalcarata]|uniref:C2H2-type domain-containing protein n=3 Tax=Rotaria magnacalcarata TaxID=392030 RepID=A0A8S2KGS3_9BILA|nr:unnamed protein product [Rotaria magnacalcarata]CAF3853832.1 unnamed protein product [Rotaria magnacalcarata]
MTGQDSKFQKCSFYDHLHDFGPSTKPKSFDVVSIDQLESNVQLGLDYVSEFDLIVSRCGVSNVEHPNCINRCTSSKHASLNLSRYVSTKYRCKFPIKGNICMVCRGQEEKVMRSTNSDSGGLSPMEEEAVEETLTNFKQRPTDLYNFRNIKNPHFNNDELNKSFSDLSTTTSQQSVGHVWEEELSGSQKANVNEIRYQINPSLNPIMYQVKNSPFTTSKRKQNMLKQSLLSILRESTSFFAKAYCPGHSKELLDLCEVPTFLRKEHDTFSNDDKILQSIKEIYGNSTDSRLKLQLLSIVVKKTYAPTDIKSAFNCNDYMITQAIQHGLNNGSCSIIPRQHFHRTRVSFNRIKHFMDFLFDHDFVQDVAYGTTKIRTINEAFTIPLVVKKCINSHIVYAYDEYCQQIPFERLSKNSLYRVLKECKMSQRTSLAGLDDYTADGPESFDALENLVSSLPVTKSKQQRIITQLHNAKRYLKIGFSLNLSLQSSISSHCVDFAPSDSNSKSDFYINCNHHHSHHCESCENLVTTLSQITELIRTSNNSKKEEWQYDCTASINKIYEWQKHLVHHFAQSKSKNDILKNLKPDAAFWLRDWSMKVLPIEYREKSSNWFGKRGMSQEVDIFSVTSGRTTSDNQQIPLKYVYLTMLDQSSKDIHTVGAVPDQVLKQFHIDAPQVKNILRKDNATCYADGAQIYLTKYICQQNGFQLKRIDFNEAGKGKDLCDRESACTKTHRDYYVSSGHNVTTALEMKQAAKSNGGVKDTKVAVVNIEDNEKTLKLVKLKDSTQYHSYEFVNNNVRAWRQYATGSGHLLKLPLFEQLEFKSGLTVISPFPPIFSQGTRLNSVKQSSQQRKRSSKKSSVLFCSDSHCVSTFVDIKELEQHLKTNQHGYFQDNADLQSLPIIEKAKIYFIGHLKGGSNIANSTPHSTTSSSTSSVTKKSRPNSIWIAQGWAQQKRSLRVSLSIQQTKFLDQLYERGEESKKSLPSCSSRFNANRN